MEALERNLMEVIPGTNEFWEGITGKELHS